MLNHPDPMQLVHPEEGRTAQNIREHYDQELRSLGLVHIARRCVKTQPTNSPLYDVVLASRKDTAQADVEQRDPPAPQTDGSLDQAIGGHLVLKPDDSMAIGRGRRHQAWSEPQCGQPTEVDTLAVKAKPHAQL